MTAAERSMAKRKNQRIEAWVTEDDAHVIARAAALLNASISSFVGDAALVKAETVLGRADRTIMPAAQFGEMIAALDDPTPVPELVALINRPRQSS